MRKRGGDTVAGGGGKDALLVVEREMLKAILEGEDGSVARCLL